ncbi:hypothetical protein BDZ97DRAFT_1825188 [Flammula alnicola]|nr:hypothetical protein BDZ97DRAFT_1857996 [Flammula alnicola]KAF8962487.1 hypothetical protein BDZ97DRAFT_1825188 [Flammula alnicola]
MQFKSILFVVGQVLAVMALKLERRASSASGSSTAVSASVSSNTTSAAVSSSAASASVSSSAVSASVSPSAGRPSVFTAERVFHTTIDQSPFIVDRTTTVVWTESATISALSSTTAPTATVSATVSA